MRWRLFLACLAIALLAACAAPMVVGCPAVVPYNEAFQKRLAGELEALAAGSALAQAMVDYKRERDQLRACRTE